MAVNYTGHWRKACLLFKARRPARRGDLGAGRLLAGAKGFRPANPRCPKRGASWAAPMFAPALPARYQLVNVWLRAAPSPSAAGFLEQRSVQSDCEGSDFSIAPFQEHP